MDDGQWFRSAIGDKDENEITADLRTLAFTVKMRLSFWSKSCKLRLILSKTSKYPLLLLTGSLKQPLAPKSGACLHDILLSTSNNSYQRTVTS